MEEILRSIRAYLYEKSVSPLAGAFVLAWSIVNYRVIVILLSGDHYSDKFAVIDKYFYATVSESAAWINPLAGKLIYGVVCPAVLALAYIFIYPLLAAPVYRYTLNRRQELRQIKQKAENARLLSVKESRDLYKRLSDMETLYDEETDQYQKQVSALQETISDLENRLADSIASSTDLDDGHGNEADIDEYDAFIERTIDERPVGRFTIAEIFGPERWEGLSVSNRQQIGRRFKQRVDRGDFLQIRSSGRNARNEATYEKMSASRPESAEKGNSNQFLADNEIAALQRAAGLRAGYGITATDISDALDVHIEEARLILSDLAGKYLMERIGSTDEEESLYGLAAEGRRYLVSNNLIARQEAASESQGTLLHESELEDFHKVISRYGLQRGDFELEESDISGPQSGEIAPLTGTVKITYEPSGVSRRYSTGHNSTWPADFEQDVARKEFQN